MTTFDLQLPNFTFDAPDDRLFANVVDLATAGEEAGFGALWVMDHFYQLPPLGGAERPMLEAYTLLGALAARTSRVRLGTLVTGVTYRNPAMLAKIVTSLDVISGGRAILGIGAAWHDEEHEALGFDFPAVRERMDRLEEALQICKAMFTEEAPTFDGTYYRIKDVRNVPRPLQAGGPPILVGGGGEKRTLRLVAQYADMCNIGGDVATVEHKVEVLRGHCADIGRDPSQVTVTRLATLLLTDTDEQTEQVKGFLAAAMGEEAAATCNVGREEEVVDQIGALAAAGVDTFIFNMPMSDPDGVRRAGALLAKSF